MSIFRAPAARRDDKQTFLVIVSIIPWVLSFLRVSKIRGDKKDRQEFPWYKVTGTLYNHWKNNAYIKFCKHHRDLGWDEKAQEHLSWEKIDRLLWANSPHPMIKTTTLYILTVDDARRRREKIRKFCIILYF